MGFEPTTLTLNLVLVKGGGAISDITHWPVEFHFIYVLSSYDEDWTVLRKTNTPTTAACRLLFPIFSLSPSLLPLVLSSFSSTALFFFCSFPAFSLFPLYLSYFILLCEVLWLPCSIVTSPLIKITHLCVTGEILLVSCLPLSFFCFRP